MKRISAPPSEASTSDIAETLNSDRAVRRPKTIHLPDGTKAQVQEPWTRDAVKDVLRRGRVYLGFVVEKRGLDQRPGHHEPIIDEATYNAALIGSPPSVPSGERPRAHRL